MSNLFTCCYCRCIIKSRRYIMTTKEEKRDALEEKRNAQRASVQLKRKEEKKDFKKSLVKRIEDTLSDKGMNQTKLADAMNVTPQQISKWLSLSKKDESTLPDIINLIQISKALNVSLDYLCGCEEKEEEKKDVSINSFNDLLLSMWNQYEYCHKSNIECHLVPVSYSLQTPVGEKHINFIGMDMDDRYIYDFLEVFKAIAELKETHKLSFEQTKDIMLNKVKDDYEDRNQCLYRLNHHRENTTTAPEGFSGFIAKAVPLDKSDKRRYKD